MVFDSIIVSGALTLETMLFCSLTSIGLGILLAFVYGVKNSYSKTFLVSVVVLPLIIQSVIMMVNGNIGAGIAVAGAFSLVRFRSAQGNAKDITVIFMAMAIGLATGMGFLLFALVFAVIAILVLVALKFVPLKDTTESVDKRLKIVVPEDLDFVEEIEPVLKEYCRYFCLMRTKTTNMGSLFELIYKIRLKNEKTKKEFLDKIRCINSNLPIMLFVDVEGDTGL